MRGSPRSGKHGTRGKRGSCETRAPWGSPSADRRNPRRRAGAVLTAPQEGLAYHGCHRAPLPRSAQSAGRGLPAAPTPRAPSQPEPETIASPSAQAMPGRDYCQSDQLLRGCGSQADALAPSVTPPTLDTPSLVICSGFVGAPGRSDSCSRHSNRANWGARRERVFGGARLNKPGQGPHYFGLAVEPVRGDVGRCSPGQRSSYSHG